MQATSAAIARHGFQDEGVPGSACISLGSRSRHAILHSLCQGLPDSIIAMVVGNLGISGQRRASWDAVCLPLLQLQIKFQQQQKQLQELIRLVVAGLLHLQSQLCLWLSKRAVELWVSGQCLSVAATEHQSLQMACTSSYVS